VPPAEAASRLSVSRHEALYLVPREHPDPAAVRRRLDALVDRRLPGALAGRFGDGVDRDPTVWLVRRLEVDLAVDLGAVDDGRLSSAWAGEVARALGRSLAQGERADGVVRFADPGAYLARFAADLARGQAAGCWYYRPLSGLSALPPSASLREAILGRGWGREVLARLVASGDLEAVLAMLGERGARAVVDGLFPTGESAAAAPDRELLPGLLGAWESGPRPGSGAAVAVLRLSAHALARDVGADGARLRATAEGLVELRSLLAAAASPAVLLAALGRRDFAAARAEIPGAAAAGIELTRLASLAAGLDGAMARRLAASPASAAETRPAPGLALVSDYAGVFLLLPALVEGGLGAALAEVGGEGTAAGLRREVLARAFGADRRREAAADPAVGLAATGEPAAGGGVTGAGADERAALAERLLALLPPQPTGEAPGARTAERDLAFLEGEGPPATPGSGIPPLADDPLERALTLAALSLSRRFAARLPGFAGSGCRHLVENFLSGGGEVRVGAREIEVRLAPRPLALVLRLSGWEGRTLTVPWWEGRTATVRLPSH
jgi:hypothetical protein